MPRSDHLRFSQSFCLLSFLIIFHIPKSSSSSFLDIYCPKDSNFPSQSSFRSFRTNLDHLLASLSSGAVATGYLNDTKGQPPDQVHGLALCRGDASPAVCGTCLNDSAQGILQRCSLGKSSTIWYYDCLIRYSDLNFFSTVDTSFPVKQYNGYNASNPEAFDRALTNLMSALIARAARNSSSKMFAAGSAIVDNGTKVYGLVQCTRDLSEDSCDACLRDAVANISSCCFGQVGMKVYGQSCYMRYENFLFFDLPTAETVPLPPPPVPSSSTQPEKNTTSDAIPGGASEGKKSESWKIIVIFSILGISFLVFCLLLWWKCSARLKGYWKKGPKLTGNTENLIREVKSNLEEKGQEGKDSRPVLFTFATIASATGDFSDSNKLGKGGFGHVYKGTLDGGQEVAVKRLSRSSHQGLEEFKNEVMVIARLQHRNLVRLLGYCVERAEKILIYEYMPNKTLEAVLFDVQKKALLDWKIRFNIIEGIVRGLIYLQRDSNLRIAHRDLKPSNILLDKDMNPKISDFGLARIFGDDQNQGNTRRPAGTIGYMAPEYVIRGLFSDKSDVYSFGVIVLEIVIGKKCNAFHELEDTPTIAAYAWQAWNEGKAECLVDESIRSSCSMSQALRCIHIALLCVQDRADDRPNMPWIDHMIASESSISQVPKKPTFVLETPLKEQTRNEMTITSLDAR